MAKDWYGAYHNGEYIQVYALEDCLRAIECRDADKQKRINYLENQVKELQDEKYKDKELQKMQKELKETKEDLYRGFSITEEEEKNISNWKKEHDTKAHNNPSQHHGCIGGGYTYRFYPTSIGTIGECVCSRCSRKAMRNAAGDYDKYGKLLKIYDGIFTFCEL